MLRQHRFELAFDVGPRGQHQFQPANFIQPLANLTRPGVVAADVEWAARLEREVIIKLADPDQFIQQAFDLPFWFGVKLADGGVTKK